MTGKSIALTGMTIGERYRIGRQLGAGGMGAVFAAENIVTNKIVAIKCMLPEYVGQREPRERFLREARAAARVAHPNVIDIYDIIDDPAGLFLVMEFLDGEPLSAILAHRDIPLHQLLEYVAGAMRGVNTAHKCGIVHRDIKPDNIFLAREPDRESLIPKVLDFGVAKMSLFDSPRLTATGALVGTPLYMSYEQLCGMPDIDVRVDVWAFAVILYEAVTGRHPFESETVHSLYLRILNDHPTSPKELRPDLPAELSHLIDHGLVKDREHRISNLDMFIARLEPFLKRHSLTATSQLSVAMRSSHHAAPDYHRFSARELTVPPVIDVENSFLDEEPWLIFKHRVSLPASTRRPLNPVAIENRAHATTADLRVAKSPRTRWLIRLFQDEHSKEAAHVVGAMVSLGMLAALSYSAAGHLHTRDGAYFALAVAGLCALPWAPLNIWKAKEAAVITCLIAGGGIATWIATGIYIWISNNVIETIIFAFLLSPFALGLWLCVLIDRSRSKKSISSSSVNF